MARYEVVGFEIDLQIEDSDTSPTVSGHVYVEAAVYFNATVTITYRLVVSDAEGFCKISRPLNTDELIILAGAPLGVEHWHSTKDKKLGSIIDLQVHKCTVKNVPFNFDGSVSEKPLSFSGNNSQSTYSSTNATFADVFSRYRAFLEGGNSSSDYASTYVLIDVWEDVGHSDDIDFSLLSAPEIIRHIEMNHRSEIMGILTLYPYEWPYRDPRYFDRVCGDNIAIDTDDFVLVSENASLIFGTYGLRGGGSPTNWREVLQRRAIDHVCWPEYLHILDIILAKLHTINHSLYALQAASITSSSNDNKKMIRNNSLVAINVSRTLIDMDAINFTRYASHKLMYKKTEERLEVAREASVLMNSLQQVDSAIKTIDSVDELRRSRIVRMLLAFITVASIFQVVFENTEIPLIGKLINHKVAEDVGIVVISLVVAGLVVMGLAALVSAVTSATAPFIHRWKSGSLPRLNNPRR